MSDKYDTISPGVAKDLTVIESANILQNDHGWESRQRYLTVVGNLGVCEGCDAEERCKPIIVKGKTMFICRTCWDALMEYRKQRNKTLEPRRKDYVNEWDKEV